MGSIIPSDECARVYSYLGLDRAYKAAGAGAGAGFCGYGWLPTHIPGCQLFCCGDTSRFPTAIVVPADPLVNGNFEGAAGPANWSAIDCTPSREAGARTGGTGSYIAKMYRSSAGLGVLYTSATPLAVGNTYTLAGWYKTEGTGVTNFLLGSNNTGNQPHTSNLWAPFSVTGACAGDGYLRVYATLGAGNSTYLDDLTLTCHNASQYTDLTGLGHHPVQATAAKQPLVVASGSGHLLRFDGAADYLAAASWTGVQPVTIYLLAKLPTVAAASKYALDATSGVANAAICIPGSSTDKVRFTASGADLEATATGNAWHIVRAIGNGASSSIAVDGGTPVTGNAGAAAYGGITIGCRGDAGGAFCNEDVGAVAVYSGAHTTAQSARVERYLRRLAQKLGVTL